jgi:hypothetical protein
MDDNGWLKEWIERQEQLKRLQDWYENHEMDNPDK